MLASMIKDLPVWAGTVPQWGMFILLAIAVVRVSPQWLNSLLTATQNKRASQGQRITELEEAVKFCREECDRQTEMLHKEIHGLRRQHIQEQISLINTIIQSVDAPQLKLFLRTLESVQRDLGEIRQLGATDDKGS